MNTPSRFHAAARGTNLVTPDQAIDDYFKSQKGFGSAFQYQRVELPTGVILHIAETRALKTFSIPKGSNEDQVRAMAFHAIEQRRLTKELQGIEDYGHGNTKPFYCAVWVILRPPFERSAGLKSGTITANNVSICLQEHELDYFEMQTSPEARDNQRIFFELGRLFEVAFKTSEVSYPAHAQSTP